jgi:Ala-tRNA(Pro) deacylase
MSGDVLDRVRELLSGAGVTYREVRHEATHTSEESARVRGESLAVGAKALLLKTDDMFRLFVMPANLQLDSKKVKQRFNAKSVRFATKEELFELTGLVPGSVPPFGSPLLPFELYADAAIGTAEDKVAFNAASLTDSIIMKASDWKAIVRPMVFSFAKLPSERC